MKTIWGSERRNAAWGVAVALLCITTGAAAAPPDDATRDAARDLAHRAGDAFQKGDYKTAQDLYHRAYALVPAPTLSLREARALEKLGRLVEATEALVRTRRTPLDDSSPKAFRDAVAEADAELASLKPRVPKLAISVSGPGRDDADLVVKMDDRSVPAALIGVAAPVDPGKHHLVATTAHSRADADVELKEGESRAAKLELVAQETTAAPPAPPTSAPVDTAPARQPAAAEHPAAPRVSRSYAYVAFGVGAIGLGTGVITGLMAANRHSSAVQNCPDNRCVEGSAGADDVSAFRSLRTISTVGYVIGAVGVGAGVALFVLSRPQEAPHAAVAAYVGPGSASIAGRFW